MKFCFPSPHEIKNQRKVFVMDFEWGKSYDNQRSGTFSKSKSKLHTTKHKNK